MLKKLFFILLAIFICAGYFIGSYFVDFALSRGNSDDPNAIPAACASIHDESRTVPALPNFSSEILSIQSNDNLTLNATHFFPEKSTNRWAILVHGYGRDQRFARDFGQEYLLNNLIKTDNPYTCPHGRPTIITYKKYDLEKLFKRAM